MQNYVALIFVSKSNKSHVFVIIKAPISNSLMMGTVTNWFQLKILTNNALACSKLFVLQMIYYARFRHKPQGKNFATCIYIETFMPLFCIQ